MDFLCEYLADLIPVYLILVKNKLFNKGKFKISVTELLALVPYDYIHLNENEIKNKWKDDILNTRTLAPRGSDLGEGVIAAVTLATDDSSLTGALPSDAVACSRL